MAVTAFTRTPHNHGLFASDFPNKTWYKFLITSMRATRPAYSIPLDEITLVLQGHYFIWPISVCHFPPLLELVGGPPSAYGLYEKPTETKWQKILVKSNGPPVSGAFIFVSVVAGNRCFVCVPQTGSWRNDAMKMFPGPPELLLCEHFHPKDKRYERECPPRYTGCLTQTRGKPDQGRTYRTVESDRSLMALAKGTSSLVQISVFRKRWHRYTGLAG
jgi:hypothetical protein